MKANKRTVWFLTLMSLVAVISIYYLNNKNPMNLDGIHLFGDEGNNTGSQVENDKQSDKQTPVFAESYLFEEIRMEVRNNRSQLKEQLTTKITSADYTPEEKNEAYNEMEKLQKRDSAEALMEILIKSLGYPDALVRTENGRVLVTVLAEEQSNARANEIISIVKSNWEDARTVEVTFKDTN